MFPIWTPEGNRDSSGHIPGFLWSYTRDFSGRVPGFLWSYHPYITKQELNKN